MAAKSFRSRWLPVAIAAMGATLVSLGSMVVHEPTTRYGRHAEGLVFLATPPQRYALHHGYTFPDPPAKPIVWTFNATVDSTTPNLTIDDFEVAISNRDISARVIRVDDKVTQHDEEASADFELVMDSSGSMPESASFDAASGMVDYLPKGTTVAVSSLADFNAAASVLAGSDVATVKQNIEALRANHTESSSSFYSLALAIDRMAERKSGAKYIVLLTDFEDSLPDQNGQDLLLKAAKDQGIKIFSVQFHGTDPAFADQRAFAERLAIETGGQYIRANDADQLAAIFNSIAGKVITTHTYSITMEAIAPAKLAGTASVADLSMTKSRVKQIPVAVPGGS